MILFTLKCVYQFDNMKKRIKDIIYIILLTIFIVVFFLSIYLKTRFNSVSTEQILYSIFYHRGTSFDSMKAGVIYVTVRTLIILSIILISRMIIIKYKFEPYLTYKLHKETKRINILEMTRFKKTIILLSLIIVSTISMFKALKLDKYIVSQKSSSTLFENYYTNPEKVKISFPDEKQNLIYIFVESLEMTNVSEKNGGIFKKTLIPNLEEIALKNTNFSNNNKLGGAYNISGASWTAASMIAQTSGLPLKLQIDTNSYGGYKESLPGAYSIGEILKSNGYANYLMMGSDATFGRRKDYFVEHGDYKIMDYNYAKEQNWIPEEYHVWWGYEDKKLYEFAKQELYKISKNNQPFNFTILTADTHFENGYTDITCPNYYDEPYANSISCTDVMLNDFIKWVQKQDFYETTTIIITGDHLTMQSDFYDEILPSDYSRAIYNVIINSKQDTKNNKNRQFTLLDMYPTTLAALGVNINGNKLGLGTNLYSKEKTLIEKLGYEKLDDEISKKSTYYDNEILKKNTSRVK